MKTVKKIQNFERDGVSFKAEQQYFVDEDGTIFDTGDLSDSNLLARQDAYRGALGLLTSQEIKRNRDLFGLSQKTFSNILGLGDITVTRYETKLVQSKNNDILLRLPVDKPLDFFDMFEKEKGNLDLSQTKIASIESAIAKYASSEESQSKTAEESVRSSYLAFWNEGIKTGNQPLRLKAISQIAYLANKICALTKTKLAKFLFYIDFLSYKETNHGVTGLAYEHLTYGAYPKAFDSVLGLPLFKKREVDYLSEDKTVIFINGYSEDELTSSEKALVNRVLVFFKDKNTKEIVEYMHKEKAYEETKQHQIINYSFAKELNLQ